MITWKSTIHRYQYADNTYEDGYVYCTDIGNIIEYKIGTKLDFAYGGLLKIITDDYTLFTGGEADTVRCKGMVGCLPEDGNMKERWMKIPRKLDKELRAKNPGVKKVRYTTVDPRVTRAYILMFYEVFRGTSFSAIDELLNESIDWSLEEAGEWLLKNDLHYLKEFIVVAPHLPNARYLCNVSQLINPYWKPQRH